MNQLRDLCCFCAVFFFLLCAFSNFAAEQKIIESGTADISADELISRVFTASTAEFQNAEGYYVVRQYVKHDEKTDAKKVEGVRLALEKSLKERIANDKKFGVTTDIEKLKKENSLALASIEKKYKEETVTEIVRYTMEGDKYRIERTAVSNTEPLEKIRRDALAGLIDLSTPSILAWNGKVSAEVVVLDSELTNDKEKSASETDDSIRSSVSYEKIARTPDFMDYGRDIKDKHIFDQFKKQNLPFNTTSVTIDGEQGVLLRIGDKNSVTFSIDTCVLPSKGYVITSAHVKTGGTVVVEDIYRDFVKVNDGSWLPTRIAKINYRIDQQGVPYVATRKELLAIDPPKVNTKLPNDTFDLANTKKFQSLSPLFRNPADERNSPEEMTTDNWFVVRLVAVLLGIVLIILGLIGKWKAFQRDRLGILFIVVVLHLAVACGCKSKDNLSGKPNEYDVILTDSATIINHPSGVIQVTAPIGMGIQKELSIKSECSGKIDAMTLTSSCGCTEALLASSDISPGQVTTVSLSFRPENALLQNKIAVNVLIRHSSNPNKPFTIPIIYSNSETLDDLRIDANPQSIVVDAVGVPDLTIKEQITLQLGKKIDTDSIFVSSESCFSKTEITNDEKEGKKKIVNAVFSNPPVGKVDEKIRINVAQNDCILYKEILITGRVLASFYCEPNTVTISEANSENDGFAEINVFKRITTLEFPVVDVTGSWEIDKKSVIDDNQLTLRVVAKRKKDEKVSYGMIRLHSSQNTSVINVPLTITYATGNDSKDN